MISIELERLKINGRLNNERYTLKARVAGWYKLKMGLSEQHRMPDASMRTNGLRLNEYSLSKFVP